MGEAQGGGVVAENAFRRLFDAAFEFVQTVPRLLFILAGFVDEIPIHQGLGGGEGIGEVGLTRLPDGVVKLFRQERFRCLGFLRDASQTAEQIGQPGFLLCELFGERLHLIHVAQAAALLRLVQLLHLAIDLLLVAGELTGLLALLAHGVGELARVFLAKILLHFLEITLGAGSGCQGFGDRLLFEGLRGVLHFLAGLVELLTRLRSLRLALRLVHFLFQFIQVRDHLPLFFAQSFEFAAQIILFLFGLGLLQRRLQFLEALVDILLALRQLLQAA